jgi:hypothetical protein
LANDKKISELPLATTPLAGTEESEIVQGGVNKRTAVSNIGTTVSAASETVAGIIEIATQAETDTGTDDLKAVTPLKLAAHLDTDFFYVSSFRSLYNY